MSCVMRYLFLGGLLGFFVGALSPSVRAEDPLQLKQEIDKLRSELDKTKKELAEERARRLEQQKLAEQLTAKLQLQQVIEATLKSAQEALQKQLLKAMQDAQAGRVEVDQAKQITAVLQKRMLQLEQEASQLRKAVAELNQKLGSQVAPQKDKLNPPNVLVKGLVKKVGEDGLLVINIGTDNGLQVGHTLEVFRATPQPKYLGSIQVLDVTPRQAVARPIGAMRIHGIEVGDQVTSKILQERQPRP